MARIRRSVAVADRDALPIIQKQLQLPMEIEATLSEQKIRGVAFYHGFNQGESWVDIEGRIWPIRNMASSHLANVLTHLRKHVGYFFFFYGLGDALVDAEGKERHDIPLVVEQFDDPIEWLEQTVLYKSVEAEIARRHEGASFGEVVG